jgi:hypothetical protein
MLTRRLAIHIIWGLKTNLSSWCRRRSRARARAIACSSSRLRERRDRSAAAAYIVVYNWTGYLLRGADDGANTLPPLAAAERKQIAALFRHFEAPGRFAVR